MFALGFNLVFSTVIFIDAFFYFVDLKDWFKGFFQSFKSLENFLI